jgi:hypothetical protein
MEHVILCKCVLLLSYTCLLACLPAILIVIVAFGLSLPDCFPALPSIKLALIFLV